MTYELSDEQIKAVITCLKDQVMEKNYDDTNFLQLCEDTAFRLEKQLETPPPEPINLDYEVIMDIRLIIENELATLRKEADECTEERPTLFILLGEKIARLSTFLENLS